MTAQEQLAPRTVVDTNPATGTAVAELNETDLSQLPDILAKAREAQAIWAAKSFKERARHIQMMRSYIVDRADDLARTVSESNGKTLTDALATEVLPCALACKWYANNAEKILKEKSRPGGSILFFQQENPYAARPPGRGGHHQPLELPVVDPVRRDCHGPDGRQRRCAESGAAATPAVGRAIEQIIAAGELPEGLFQHVVGSGAKVATGFFDNGIDKLFFTGSVPAGKTLMAQAADTLTPVSLELGGNDPMIVLEDADLERATNGAAWAGYQNAGQSCGGVERGVRGGRHLRSIRRPAGPQDPATAPMAWAARALTWTSAASLPPASYAPYSSTWRMPWPRAPVSKPSHARWATWKTASSSRPPCLPRSPTTC